MFRKQNTRVVSSSGKIISTLKTIVFVGFRKRILDYITLVLSAQRATTPVVVDDEASLATKVQKNEFALWIWRAIARFRGQLLVTCCIWPISKELRCILWLLQWELKLRTRLKKKAMTMRWKSMTQAMHPHLHYQKYLWSSPPSIVSLVQVVFMQSNTESRSANQIIEWLKGFNVFIQTSQDRTFYRWRNQNITSCLWTT